MIIKGLLLERWVFIILFSDTLSSDKQVLKSALLFCSVITSKILARNGKVCEGVLPLVGIE